MPQLEDGYLKLANELVRAYASSRIPGEAMQCLWVIISKTYGFNKLEDRIAISQFSDMTGLKKQHAHRAISKLIELNLVTKKGDGNSISYCINKKNATWKLSPKKVTYPKKVQGVPVKGDKAYPKKGNTKDTTKDTITKESIYSIFEFWNIQEITKHRTIDKCKSNINASLVNYSEEEIKEAISNYKTILTENKYYWTHKWTLKDFLTRGLDQFVTENNPFDNYKTKNGSGKGGYQTRSEKNAQAKEEFLNEGRTEIDITPKEG